MSINVNYSPPLADIQGLAYGAGLGQYRQRQQELSIQTALQQMQMQQQAQQAAMHNALSLRNQMLHEQMAMADDQRQAWALQAQDADRDAARKDLGDERAWGRKVDMLGFADKVAARDEAAKAREADAAAATEKMDFAYDASGVATLEKEVAARQKAANSVKLNPEGQRLYGEIAGKLRAVQKSRGELRPRQYQEMLGQWLDEFDKSGLENHVIKPPTPEEIIKNGVHPIGATEENPLGNGNGIIINQGKDGTPKIEIKELVPQKTGANKGPQTADQHLSDFPSYIKSFSAVRKELEAAAKSRAGVDEAPKVVTDEEVAKTLAKRQKMHDEFLKSRGVKPEGEEPTKPAPEQAAEQAYEQARQQHPLGQIMPAWADVSDEYKQKVRQSLTQGQGQVQQTPPQEKLHPYWSGRTDAQLQEALENEANYGHLRKKQQTDDYAPELQKEIYRRQRLAQGQVQQAPQPGQPVQPVQPQQPVTPGQQGQAPQQAPVQARRPMPLLQAADELDAEAEKAKAVIANLHNSPFKPPPSFQQVRELEEHRRALLAAAKAYRESPGSRKTMPIPVRTPEEAKQLPKGTWIMTPKGLAQVN